MVAAAEKNFGAGPPIADTMTSDAACLVKGFENYQYHQTSRLVEWTSCYWYLYYRHILGPSAAVKFEEAAKEIDEQGLEEEDDEEEQESNVDEEEEDEIVEEDERSDEDGNTNEDEDNRRFSGGKQPALKKKSTKRTSGKKVKEEIVTELKKKFTAELMVDLRERIVIELKKELMGSFKKEVKEALKQELKLELKAELTATTKIAHSEGHFETAKAKGQLGDLSKAGGDMTMAEYAEGQGANVEEIAHGISDHETREVGFADEWHVLGEPARQELDEEQIVDDEEQGNSLGNEGYCSIKGPY